MSQDLKPNNEDGEQQHAKTNVQPRLSKKEQQSLGGEINKGQIQAQKNGELTQIFKGFRRNKRNTTS